MSQLSIVIHVMSGNPSYGILDRVPYIDVLHVSDNASGMLAHEVGLNTACKVQIRFMRVMHDRRSYASVCSGSEP
jgi:hypothetical protein